MNSGRRLIATLVLLAVTAVPSMAAPTAFRISDMDLRDPHVFMNFIGCRDVTDTQLAGFAINGSMQTSIETDSNGDGRLDLNYILVFDPLDQSGTNGPLSFLTGECSAPMAGTSCWPGSSPPVTSTWTNSVASACLGSIVGTTHGYTPAITTSSAPCFSALLGTVTLNLAGIPVTLHDTYIAATYVGNPAASLTNGLIRGFISEADANATIIPNSMPLVGGLPFSQLLPGGTNCCATFSDKDTNAGVVGWYMYLNFTAAQVPLYDHPVAVQDGAPALTLDAPHPNPFNPSTEIHYVLPSAARVQITIYDASGRVVSVLANEEQIRGDHSVHWNGRDARGNAAGSGVYFVKLVANGETRTQKMVLLK
jgi:hypothetical protein